jgi:hypothetical protein
MAYTNTYRTWLPLRREHTHDGECEREGCERAKREIQYEHAPTTALLAANNRPVHRHRPDNLPPAVMREVLCLDYNVHSQVQTTP